jgi:TP901 family phage tail tape measure protein
MANNRRLNATITIGGAVSGSLKSALGNTKQSLSQVGDAIKHVHDRQKELNRVIAEESKLGSSASALKVDYARREIGDLDERLNRLREINEALRENQAAQEENLANREELRNSALDMVALGAAIAVPINAAMKFETAMLGVGKQIDGARDSSGKLTPVYFDMAKQIQALGRGIPIATNEIAEMVAAGARMGVAKNELIGFTRTAAMMAEAFEMPAGELAEQMGEIAGLYSIPIPAIGSLADAINFLDDTSTAKGGDIINFMTRVGGVASAVKISSKEVAALGSTLLTLGEQTETASTATNAMLQKLAAADKGTKAFKGAMKQIGLSTSSVQKGMQKDAAATLLKVLDQIAKLPKEKQLGVMVDLVGLEHSDTLAKLANNTAEFRKQIAAANSEAAKGSMSKEFAARLGTTSTQLTLLGNSLTEISVNIGSVLLPAINATIGVMAPFINIVADLARENPVVTQAIVGTAVALGALRVAVWGVSYAYTFVKGAALTAAGWFYTSAAAAATAGGATAGAAAGPTLLGRAFIFASKGVLWLGRALLTTPIGIAITAIAGAAYLIYKNWEPLKAFFARLWSDITITFNTALSWISRKIEWIGQTWGKTKQFFGFGSGPTVVGAAVSPSGQAKSSLPSPRLPSVPVSGGDSRRANYTDNSQTTIHVTQQPGQSTRQLAEEITRIQEQQKGIRQRGRLTDFAGAQ